MEHILAHFEAQKEEIKIYKNILYVEGSLDIEIYNKFKKDNIGIFKYSDVHDSQYKYVKKELVKAALELERRNEETKALFIIDRDFDDNQYIKNVFYTDTSDLETLILSKNSVDFKNLYPELDKIKKSIECLAFQLTWIRKGIYSYKDNQNVLDTNSIFLNDEIIYCNNENVFKLNEDIDLDNFFEKLRTAHAGDNPFLLESYGLIKRVKNHTINFLKENGIIDDNEKFIININNFERCKVNNYWKTIRGHDYLRLFSCFSNLNYYDIENYIVKHVDFKKLVDTKLFKTLIDKQIFMPIKPVVNVRKLEINKKYLKLLSKLK